MDPKQQVLDYLNGQSIPFDLVEHPAVYTIEEVLALGLPPGSVHCKKSISPEFQWKIPLYSSGGTQQNRGPKGPAAADWFLPSGVCQRGSAYDPSGSS